MTNGGSMGSSVKPHPAKKNSQDFWKVLFKKKKIYVLINFIFTKEKKINLILLL